MFFYFGVKSFFKHIFQFYVNLCFKKSNIFLFLLELLFQKFVKFCFKKSIFFQFFRKNAVLRRNRAFFLWPGFIDFFWNFLWFHGYFGNKSWNQGGFMKCKNKIIWNHLGIRLGPRTVVPTFAPREARSEGRSDGPRAQPDAQVVSIFFFALHEYHLGFKIYCQNIREYHQKFQKKSMKSRSQK